MNVTIKLGSTDISHSVVSYHRMKYICSGVGTIQVIMAKDNPYDPGIFNVISVWEDGYLSGKFYIKNIVKIGDTGLMELECQDGSTLLQDYFIAESYTVDYPSYNKYWISKFLTEAQVSFNYNATGPGTLLSNNTGFGLDTAYNTIVQLCQMSGWYFYFDGDNVCQIGKLNVDASLYKEKFDETNIIKITTTKDDEMLRNRIVVWGNGNVDTNSYVHATEKVITPYNYDDKDYRTVVLSNSSIKDNASADYLTRQALKEFSKITYIKELTVPGGHDLDIGDLVFVSSRLYTGTGLITSIGSQMGREGLTTIIELDRRCPRLFGYFDWGGNVYVGTAGSGIWQKPIKYDMPWSDYSTGITNLNITDLDINNGVFATVSDHKDLYVRDISNASWLKVDPGVLVTHSGDKSFNVNPSNSGVSLSGLWCSATVLNREDNRVYAAYNTRPYTLSGYTYPSGVIIPSGMQEEFSWIVETNGYGYVSNQYPVFVATGIGTSSQERFTNIDLACDDKNIIGTYHTASPNSERTTYYDFPKGLAKETFTTVNKSPVTTFEFPNLPGNSTITNVVIDDLKVFVVSYTTDGNTYSDIIFHKLDRKTGVHFTSSTFRVSNVYNGDGDRNALWVDIPNGIWRVKLGSNDSEDVYEYNENNNSMGLLRSYDWSPHPVNQIYENLAYAFSFSGGNLHLYYYDLKNDELGSVVCGTQPSSTLGGGSFSFGASGIIYFVLNYLQSTGGSIYFKSFQYEFNLTSMGGNLYTFSDIIGTTTNLQGTAWYNATGTAFNRSNINYKQFLEPILVYNDTSTIKKAYLVERRNVSEISSPYSSRVLYGGTSNFGLFINNIKGSYFAHANYNGGLSSGFVYDLNTYTLTSTGIPFPYGGTFGDYVSPLYLDVFDGTMYSIYENTNGHFPIANGIVGVSETDIYGVIPYYEKDLFGSPYVQSQLSIVLYSKFGENCLAVKRKEYGYDYATSHFTVYQWGEAVDYQEQFMGSDYVLLSMDTNTGEFRFLQSLGIPYNVDASIPVPFSYYPTLPSGLISISGFTLPDYTGFVVGSGFAYNIMPAPPAPILDARSFYSEAFISISGVVASGTGPFLLMVTEGGLFATDPTNPDPGLNKWHSITSFSGNTTNHIETTNTPDYPYIFVSTSGNNPIFYQKDGRFKDEAETPWQNESQNLPSVAITIIRTDDLI